MTERYHRRFRLIYEAGTKRPWVVQYGDNLDAHTWTDILRFHETDQGRAVAYLEDVRHRDHILEADR